MLLCACLSPPSSSHCLDLRPCLALGCACLSPPLPLHHTLVRPAGPRLAPFAEVRLLGAHTLSDALRALQPAIQAAVPAGEHAAAAKRALLGGLLQRGLAKAGPGVFRQSLVHVAQATEALHEVRRAARVGSAR